MITIVVHPLRVCKHKWVATFSLSGDFLQILIVYINEMCYKFRAKHVSIIDR